LPIICPIFAANPPDIGAKLPDAPADVQAEISRVLPGRDPSPTIVPAHLAPDIARNAPSSKLLFKKPGFF
jgi:hypothetical protein